MQFLADRGDEFVFHPLQVLALGDVLHGGGYADHLSRLVAQGGHVPLALHEPPVARQQLQHPGTGMSATHEFRDESLGGGLDIAGNQCFQGILAQHFGAPVAEHALGRWIPGNDAILQIGLQHGQGCLLDVVSQPAALFPDEIFRLTALADFTAQTGAEALKPLLRRGKAIQQDKVLEAKGKGLLDAAAVARRGHDQDDGEGQGRGGDGRFGGSARDKQVHHEKAHQGQHKRPIGRNQRSERGDTRGGKARQHEGQQHARRHAFRAVKQDSGDAPQDARGERAQGEAAAPAG